MPPSLAVDAPAAAPSPAGGIEPFGVVFETPAWARLVRDCYGFPDRTLRAGGAHLPLFETRSPLLADKLSSAVFNSYAGPADADEAACEALVGRAIALARSRHVRCLELKCLFDLPPAVVRAHGLVRAPRFKATVVPLGSPDAVRARYHRTFRKHLRQAARPLAAEGVTIAPTTDLADVRRFHDLLVRQYRDRHRMIAQPWRLFELLHRRFLEPGTGTLLVARARGRVMAGLLFLAAGDTVTGCYGAYDARFASWSLDTVLKDAALVYFAAAGFARCDLGLSSPAQHGLLFAKARFGGVTFDAPWYYAMLDGRGVPDVDFARSYMALRRPFRFVPVPVAKRLSSVLVRYLN